MSDEEDSLDDNRESSLSIEDEIFFPWIELDESQIEPLVLPSSSSDLLIDGDHLFDALEVSCCKYSLNKKNPNKFATSLFFQLIYPIFIMNSKQFN